jgi:hypothetical protein
MNKIIISLILISLPDVSAANGLKSAKAQQMADQLVRSINQKLRDIAQFEIAAGVDPHDIKIELSQQESFNTGRFGAILDAGVLGRVVSVTPKSQADNLGLQSGDVILSVNNNPLTLTDQRWKNQLQYTQDNTDVSLKVKRQNQEVSLAGKLRAHYTPRWELNSELELLTPITQVDENDEGCGRIILGGIDDHSHGISATSYYLHQYASGGIYSIDGIRKSAKQLIHKLSVGYHRLRFSAAGQNSKKRRQLPDRSIHIEPNTTYYLNYEISAEDNRTNGYATYLKHQTNQVKANLTMVIRKTKQQSCEL